MAIGSRSFSVNVESVVTGEAANSATERARLAELTCQSIDINVIQPTPNISPSASLKSIEAESQQPTADKSADVKTAEVKAADMSPTANGHARTTRRVSFSEDEVTSVSSDPTGEATTAPPSSNQRRGSRGGSLATSLRQMTVPMSANATMTYLQVNSVSSIPQHFLS
jgi:hypothetical protein